MNVYSEDDDFLNRIVDIKKSKREQKNKKKLIYFYDILDSEEEVEKFRNKFLKL